MSNPDVSRVGVHGDGVGANLGAEMLEAVEHGFGVRFVVAVDIGMRGG